MPVPPKQPLPKPIEIESETAEKEPKGGLFTYGFFMLFKKTFAELFSLKRVIPYVILSFIFPFIFSSVTAEGWSVALADMSFDYQVATVVNYFAFYSFFWSSGIVLWIFCGISASTFISSEENAGTLVILLTKPIRRRTIFFGKFLGYFLNMAILQFMSLMLSLTVTCSIFGTSSSVFFSGMKFLLPIYFYTLLMIAVIGITLGFLSIINKRTAINVMISTLLVFIIYLLGMILRVAIPTYYESWGLYFFDLGYHLSLIYLSFIQPFGFQAIPFFQQMFGMFFGTYISLFTDPSEFMKAIDPENGLTFLVEESGYLSPIVSFILLIATTIVLLIIGIIILERKDVGG